MPEKFSFKQTLQMRRNFVGGSCKLHFEVSPLNIVRASRQYLYDASGTEYLDCINNVSHVGHCHPQVVHAGQQQMATLNTCAGFLCGKMAEYSKRLVETFPEPLCVCFFVNSGSEANDLALRLARSYTKREDVMVIDSSYHGNLESLMDISPVKFKRKINGKKDWVHVAPCPDIYRGIFREDTPDVGLRYANEAIRTLELAQEKGRSIAAFMSEPALSLCGVILPPTDYLKTVYRAVREAGGVCIADEVQVGLGRTGEHFWAFQSQDVIPDIVTVGKPLGNGHPMAVVVTTKEIADSLEDFSSTFGGNPVACAVGLAVLDVIKNEKLMSSAMSVGKCLLEGFRAILPSHPMMGDVRGMGMLVGVEIVKDKISRKPAKEAAEILAYKMKEEKIIVAYEGPDRNVIFITPPLCFTCDNARRLVQTFHRLLESIERGALSAGLTSLGPSHKAAAEDPDDVPIQVLSDCPENRLCLGEEDEDSDDGQPRSKHARYEEMD